MRGYPSLGCCGRKVWIAPGDPERSYVLDKLRGQILCGGARMPLGKPPLDDGELSAISDWICEGAKIPL